MENKNSVDRKNKRKMEIDEEQQEQKQQENQENEEEKMEEFFALIRNIREMHDRLRSNSGLQEDRGNTNMEAHKVAAAAAWNPKFQPEDFLENFNNIDMSKKNNFHGEENQNPGSSSKAEAEKTEAGAGRKEGNNNDLDLNLSL